jgi:hypothetical protein
MKPINHSSATPSRIDTNTSGAGQPAAARASGSGAAPQQRVGTNAPAGLPSTPRPAGQAGESLGGPQQPVRRASSAGMADALTNESEHSVATVRRSNARPTSRSFDDTVQIRHFKKKLSVARSNSGEEEMPLRSVAPLEGPRAGGRRRPPAAPAAADPAPPAAANPAPAISRWDNSGSAQRGGAGGLAPPRRRAAADDQAPAARAPVPRANSEAAPRAPVRRPDPDDDHNSV